MACTPLSQRRPVGVFEPSGTRFRVLAGQSLLLIGLAFQPAGSSRPRPPRNRLARGHATIRKTALTSEGGGSERCASMSSEPNLRVSSGAHSLPHAVLVFGGVRRWLMANRVQPVVGPEADEQHAAPQAWWKVMCLTGVDYF